MFKRIEPRILIIDSSNEIRKTKLFIRADYCGLIFLPEPSFVYNSADTLNFTTNIISFKKDEKD